MIRGFRLIEGEEAKLFSDVIAELRGLVHRSWIR